MLGSHISDTVKARHDRAGIERRSVFFVAYVSARLEFPPGTRLGQHFPQLCLVTFEESYKCLRLNRTASRKIREDGPGAQRIFEGWSQRATMPPFPTGD